MKQNFTFRNRLINNNQLQSCRCTILFDRDGNSISSAGEWPNSDQNICAAVAANIWLTLEKASRISPNAIQVSKHLKFKPFLNTVLDLNFLLMEAEN